MKILTYFLTLFLFFSPISAKEFRIDFSDEGMKALKKKGFGKKTVYTNSKDDKGYYLKAMSDSGATGLGVEIKNKELLEEMPFLNVTFKIEQDFTNIDQTTKDGHDWAARVMIGHGKKIGSKLLSLSHSSFLNEGFLQQSPWTKGSRDYVISNDKSGEWHTRKVNVKELLEKTHNISFTNFLAVFSDSNNSKQKIIAYYRDIYFSSE
ncbi:MAG: DUF3047 domain-containing protein [Pelagibacteraceae bacterium]|jgi:hypothetical protein|nr:DUF3047 domain-containing protein [Pelagibacteraceae bacterium]